MKLIVSLRMGALVAVFSAPVWAMPLGTVAPLVYQNAGVAGTLTSDAGLIQARYRRHSRRSPAADVQTKIDEQQPYTARPFGGYEVNRYGFGNYVAGPAGFGGYPAGSGGDFVYRQQQTQKCEYAPETC